MELLAIQDFLWWKILEKAQALAHRISMYTDLCILWNTMSPELTILDHTIFFLQRKKKEVHAIYFRSSEIITSSQLKARL